MVAGNIHAINKSSSASHSLITTHNGESALSGLLNLQASWIVYSTTVKFVLATRAHSPLLMYFEKNQLFNRPSPQDIENFSSFSAPALIKA